MTAVQAANGVKKPADCLQVFADHTKLMPVPIEFGSEDLETLQLGSGLVFRLYVGY